MLPSTARFRVIDSFSSGEEKMSDGRAPAVCLCRGSGSREDPSRSHSSCFPPPGNSCQVCGSHFPPPAAWHWCYPTEGSLLPLRRQQNLMAFSPCKRYQNLADVPRPSRRGAHPTTTPRRCAEKWEGSGHCKKVWLVEVVPLSPAPMERPAPKETGTIA